jgi:acetyltransferase-like isoleucine patch superfamily enzyme
MQLGYYFLKKIDRIEYIHIPWGLLLLNWIIQRIFRINSEIPYSIHYTSRVSGADLIKIDNSVRLSFAVSGSCHIVAGHNAKLEIGRNTIFAYGVCIHTINHDLKNRNIFIAKPVKIGENCWLGNSCTILPGVTLGDNVTVGANSVVTKSFPDNVVIAGIPAKIIKNIE